ncbi:MAG: hypothetical protein JXR90_06865 [Spirochaetes bacterium]|nr:hypothetical protein [Spirochaetota bacterium]
MQSRFKTYLFINLLSLFFGSTCFAVEHGFKFISFVDYYGGIEYSEGYENLRSRLFFRPEYSANFDNSNSELVISTNLWAQPVGDPNFIDPYDIPNEAYFSKKTELFDITVGQKLVTYGFADIYGPFNAPHSSHQALLSLDDQFEGRRPDPLFQLRFYPTLEDILEFTYIPVTRPDKEQPDDVYLSETQDTVIWSNDPYLTDNLHSFFLNYKRYGENFDIQLLYGWYTEHTPDFIVNNISSSDSYDIKPEYHHKHTIGAAYATRVGNTTLSQDFALNITKDFSGKDLAAQDSDITVNTQILANLPWDILSQYTIVYCYFFNHDEYDRQSDSRAAEYLAEQFHDFHNQPYQHILFFVGHFEKSFLREKLKAQLNMGFFFSPNIYVAPRLAYSITDTSRLETGIEYTFGKPKDIDLRRNPSNDNFFIRFIMQY